MDKEALKKHGVFSWNELNTKNVDESKAFYSELMGWTLVDADMGGMTYTIIKAGDEEVGGMMTPPDDEGNCPTLWQSYVTVDDVDVRATRAEALGGKICVPPTDIPDVGRFSLIADPHGAMLGIISYLDKE